MFFIFTPNFQKKPVWLIFFNIFQMGWFNHRGCISAHIIHIFRFKTPPFSSSRSPGLPGSFLARPFGKEQARRYDAERKALMDHSGTSFERSYEALAGKNHGFYPVGTSSGSKNGRDGGYGYEWKGLMFGETIGFLSNLIFLQVQ